jgi:hypothetical protein
MRDCLHYVNGRLWMKKHHRRAIDIDEERMKIEVPCYIFGSIILLCSPYSSLASIMRSVDVLRKELKIEKDILKNIQKTEKTQNDQ